jgi:resuscitation-promoting factor RpfB
MLPLLGVAGGLVFVTLHKEVRLSVDGAVRSVGTMASSVGDLLAEEGISLNRHDRVQPVTSASLGEGTEVRVLLAKQVTLLLDGAQRSVWVTGGKTVDQVLEQINLRSERHAYVQPSRGATVEHGDVIVYQPAVRVRLNADGQSREVISNAEDVGTLLDSLGVRLDRMDRVEPSRHAPLEQGLPIRVMRVEHRRVVEESAISYGTQVRYSRELLQGLRRLEREGVPGLRRTTFEVRLENGREVARRQLGSQAVREPMDQVILEGTRPPHVSTGEASWYHRTGLVAAHPSLAFGTQVKVTSMATGRTVVVVINDRGPYIGGRIIDLSDDAFARIAPLGAGTIAVRIAW